MNGALYWKNRLPFLIVNVLCMLALCGFLRVNNNSWDSIILIFFVWILILAAGMGISYAGRKKQMDKLLKMTEDLKERYLIVELMKTPERADDQVFYQVLKLAEKSMLECIGTVRLERKEYKEYIEQWVHEVKTPITAMKLLCENNRSEFTRELLVELEKTDRFTEQALYYTRSEHTEKDYAIREIRLFDAVHQAIADNKYLLRQNCVQVKVEDSDVSVYSDDKWIRFIINQLIANAVKYRKEQLTISFSSERKNDQVLLLVADNGIGISDSDLPRIFEKGFTGSNGRTRQNSTGIGLYLCRRLCGKLGIGIEAYSDSSGTMVVLSFHINDLIHQVQG